MILVVEDEPGIATLFRDVLEDEGDTMLVATDGAKATRRRGESTEGILGFSWITRCAMEQSVDVQRPVLFTSARVVTTANAMDIATRHGTKVTALLERHFAGDWGAVTPHEATQNEAVLAIYLAGNGRGTLLSDYPLDDDPQGEYLWVVTHLDDGGVTNVLCPDEY